MRPDPPPPPPYAIESDAQLKEGVSALHATMGSSSARLPRRPRQPAPYAEDGGSADDVIIVHGPSLSRTSYSQYEFRGPEHITSDDIRSAHLKLVAGNPHAGRRQRSSSYNLLSHDDEQQDEEDHQAPTSRQKKHPQTDSSTDSSATVIQPSLRGAATVAGATAVRGAAAPSSMIRGCLRDTLTDSLPEQAGRHPPLGYFYDSEHAMLQRLPATHNARARVSRLSLEWPSLKAEGAPSLHAGMGAGGRLLPRDGAANHMQRWAGDGAGPPADHWEWDLITSSGRAHVHNARASKSLISAVVFNQNGQRASRRKGERPNRGRAAYVWIPSHSVASPFHPVSTPGLSFTHNSHHLTIHHHSTTTPTVPCAMPRADTLQLTADEVEASMAVNTRKRRVMTRPDQVGDALQWPELVDERITPSGHHPSKARLAHSTIPMQVARAFNFYDVNGSGFLDSGELRDVRQQI